MSRRDSPSGLQTELLADLQIDLRDRLPVGAPEPAVTPAASRRYVPAFELRVTPLHWCLPRVYLLPTGTGIAARSGPVQLALTLS